MIYAILAALVAGAIGAAYLFGRRGGGDRQLVEQQGKALDDATKAQAARRDADRLPADARRERLREWTGE